MVWVRERVSCFGFGTDSVVLGLGQGRLFGFETGSVVLGLGQGQV